jgi:tetratricopeptide (TPR) repeat protein
LLALAHQRLGEIDTAERWLEKAEQWLDRSRRDKPHDDTLGRPVPWPAWLEVQLLRDEAENLEERDRQTLAELDRAVQKAPDDPAGWRERARFRLWRRDWDEAAADYGRALEKKPEDASLWLERGRFLGLRGRWRQAATDLDRAAELRPRDAAVRLECGRAHAEAEQWREAAAQFEKACELLPNEPSAWYYQALARLGADQTEEYRRVCAAMMQRFAKSNQTAVTQVVVQACRLAPGAVADLAPVLRLAERAVEEKPASYPALRLRGQVLYRAEQFDAAAKQLETALRVHAVEDLLFATDAFYLAMAEQRRGRANEARKWLDRATRITTEAGRQEPPEGSLIPREPWFNRLVLQLLQREAETLVRPAP